MTNQSDAAILERAKSLSSRAIFTIALQHHRLRTEEPEDNVFIFQFQADLEFLIVALRRLRRAAGLAARVEFVEPALRTAIDDFDKALPNLVKMRNVSEHFDDYTMDGQWRRHRDVQPGQLQVFSWDGTEYEWLDGSFNIDIACVAARRLSLAVGHAFDDYVKAYPPDHL